MTRPVHRVAPATDSPIRQDGLRAHNLILTFRQIAGSRRAPISRSELSTATGLTRPTISRIVDELLAAGLIVEAAPARSGNSGRPRVGLSLARTGPAGLGLDIRAGALSACVVDLSGTVRHLDFLPHPTVPPPVPPASVPRASVARASVSPPSGPSPSGLSVSGSPLGSSLGSPVGSPVGTLRALAGMAERAIAAAAAEDLTVVGATLAVPGPVERETLVRFAPALGWRDVDAGAVLGELIAAPVSVGNDAALATLGELYAGPPELRDFVCVSGEFDIGAGIVLDGAPQRGSRGYLGHVTVAAGGRSCACGATGCLQGYAGLREILIAAGGDDTGAAPAVAIDELVTAGAPRVIQALDRAGTALGVALSALLNLAEVDTVLLGGGYSLLASWLTEGIEREIRSRVLTARWSPVQVRPAPLGPDAAAIGAALHAVDRVRRDPNRWLARTR
ncbi:ROK family transcriptional regulator [Actinoplanes derwentensis]|uniref:Sugar kinase of the NBD/HSP70 family, may contain an N-terminal HTH domain n=1 Tax=Actinoplanes derwentensis TaxID=113562 RepID=A0A1H2DBP0_9ACTN|nr:ROK family transcriptional regulator [Actinoplanes derwentensis]GID87543.1 xylose repressor [Actinoplanes derwentensis]SDT80121.1 Sugar kinase of the NBD/HSP70 family, may contain an N-terminal HTH domain [Actinoplanes derwentensis]